MHDPKKFLCCMIVATMYTSICTLAQSQESATFDARVVKALLTINSDVDFQKLPLESYVIFIEKNGGQYIITVEVKPELIKGWRDASPYAPDIEYVFDSKTLSLVRKGPPRERHTWKMVDPPPDE